MDWPWPIGLLSVFWPCGLFQFGAFWAFLFPTHVVCCPSFIKTIFAIIVAVVRP